MLLGVPIGGLVACKTSHSSQVACMIESSRHGDMLAIARLIGGPGRGPAAAAGGTWLRQLLLWRHKHR